MLAIGKQIAGRTYFHISLWQDVDPAARGLIEEACLAAGVRPDEDFNVVRLDASDTVALLSYPQFFDVAFPSLARSWKVRIAERQVNVRHYHESLNPPILHRKELLIRDSHPEWNLYSRLTADLEAIGCFADPVRIGFKLQWEQLLKERGFKIEGHQLIPVGNAEPPSELDLVTTSASIARHLTALTRSGLSAPVQCLRRYGFLEGTHTFFDYGCGKGDDIRALLANGINATGWDPHYANEAQVAAADVVNLGFVINVIEDPVERRDALTRAFSLAKEVLAVSAMIATENEMRGTPYGDGVLTSRVTFQKYYTQAELRDYLTTTLNEPAISIAPGIFFIFRDKFSEQRFLSSRVRGAPRVFHPPRLISVQRSPRPRREPRPRKPGLFEANQDLLQGLWQQWVELGREPEPEEIPHLEAVTSRLGSLRRALNVLSSHFQLDHIDHVRRQRTDDIKVYLAIERFQRRTPYKKLEPRLQRDVRAFFGTYSSAQEHALQLLNEAARPEVLDDACRVASEAGIGFFEPSHSLQLHSELVQRLPAVLRLYVACGAILYGDVSQCDLVKIHIRSGKLSFMKYDDFLGKPIPNLVERAKVDLRKLDFQLYTYGADYDCPPLYFKSRYINEETPHYAEQLAFDETLSGMDLDWSGFGPTEADLGAALRQQRLRIAEFRFERHHDVPDLDECCGKFLSYRQLIECGETQKATGLANEPKNPETYTALFDLASSILDPVIEYFGGIELTFGFCSPSLARLIPGRIAPELDQHAAHEHKKDGRPICDRLGAAVDFLVRDENMREVADWIIGRLPFDRLYFYGEQLPLHVSVGPQGRREAFEMIQHANGRRTPRPYSSRRSMP